MTVSVNKPVNLFWLLTATFILVTSVAVFTGQYYLVAVPFGLLFFLLGWQYRNGIFYLLLFTLPFSFEYNFSSGLGTDIPDEFLMLLVSFLFLAYCIYAAKSFSKSFLQHPLFLLLILILCWAFVTVLFSTHQQVSLKYLLAKSWYIGAFVIAPLVVFNQKKNIVIGSATLAGSMLLVTAIALFRHYQTGFSFATVNEAISPFFRNHVTYSAMLVCILPVLVAFFRLTRKKNLKLLLASIIIIAIFALLFSYARGAWLALITGIAAYWLIKRRMLLASYITIIGVAFSLLFWVKNNDRYLQYAHDYKTTIFHKNFSEHLIATYKLKDVSTEERFYRWIAGVRMIKDSWLTGFGPNTFYNNYKGYTVPAYKTWVSDNPEHSTVHNYFLLTAIEQGLPGLMFLLLFFGALLYYAQKLYHRCQDIFYKTIAIIIGVILSMIITVNFLSDLIETDKIGSLFFLCLAMLIIIDEKTKEKLNLPPDVESIP